MEQKDIVDKKDDMKKLYTLFLKKNKNELTPFPLTKYLMEFLEYTKADGIFIMPGHLSSIEKNKSGKYSYQELLDIFLGTGNLEFFGFGNAYYSMFEHGRKITPEEERNKQDEIKSKIENHEKHIKGKGKYILNIKRNYQSDHSKMIFAFRYKGDQKWEYEKELTCDNYNTFLELIEIIGVSTGSSNFSKSAYGTNKENKEYKAYNGESDILMFYNVGYKNKICCQIEEEQEKDISQLVLSESITRVDKDFFKNMLENVFENMLKAME